MPASTVGSWEAMTSDIISGNSTFMVSAWMKVLRQNRLTFLTICARGKEDTPPSRRANRDVVFFSLAAPQGPTYLVHGVHELGEMVEPLRTGHQTLLFDVDGLGQLPDVQLPHLFKRSLTFESLERHWRHRGRAAVKHAVYFEMQQCNSSAAY